MLERYLIEHCSPTLASLKTANLFTYSYASEHELCKHVFLMNEMLMDKGIGLIVLKKQNNAALIYVCRVSFLIRDLSNPCVAYFLREYGYECTDIAYAIQHLKERLATSREFPHEIGVFLGYPLGDVIGFIQNAGLNSRCSGCWKVYYNEYDAVKLFARFKKCREVYIRLWKQGRSLRQLTVAA